MDKFYVEIATNKRPQKRMQPEQRKKVKKILFKIDTDKDGWPPVASEGIWCEQKDELYIICNAPFFVKGIAYGDIIRIRGVSDNEFVVEEVVEKSGNSTVWLYFGNKEVHKILLEDLGRLGCGYEGGAIEGYFSVNVPKDVSMDNVSNIIAPAEERGDVFAAYPADRH